MELNPDTPPIVFLALPYEELLFARRCALQCFSRGEIPLSVHLGYAHVLDFSAEQERAMADRAAYALMARSTKVVCYVDHKITPEMSRMLHWAHHNKLPIEFRRLAGGRPATEGLHFQNIPHDERDCALCLGPIRVAQLKAKVRTDYTPDELAHLSTLPKPKE